MSWDLFCKALVKECAQDFVSYFAPGARYVGMREGQVQTRTDGSFDPREMRGDTVPEAERAGKRFLLNAECQSSKDEKMDERLLGYSYELTRLHSLPVLSVVIYMQQVKDEPQAPLVRSIPGAPLPGGSPSIWFDYVSLKLHEESAERLLALDLDAFAVLALLCADGGASVILEVVLDRLQRHGRKEAIAVALFFAGKTLTSEEDRKFLRRKYAMLRDETLKDNWTYQQMLADGMEEGIAQGIAQGIERGIEQGIERGRVDEARLCIESFLERRFPTLLVGMKEQIEQITDLGTLREFLLTVGLAQTADEVRQSLLALR